MNQSTYTIDITTCVYKASVRMPDSVLLSQCRCPYSTWMLMMNKQDIHCRNVHHSLLTRPPIAMSRSSVRIKTMLGFRFGLAVTLRPLSKVTQIKSPFRKVGRQCPTEAIIPCKCQVVQPPPLVQTAQLDRK